MPRSFLRSLLPATALAFATLGFGGLSTGCSSAASDASTTANPAEDEQALSTTPVAELQAELKSMLGDISASSEQYYLGKTDAVAWLAKEVRAAGIEDPTTATFVLQVRTFPLEYGIPFDHSEVDIDAVSDGSTVAKLKGRLLGDIWGAGLYEDKLTGGELGPPLCVTWDELVAAVEVSYVDGFYLGTFVCHNVTFRVLDKLGVSVSDYSSKIRAWKLASYAYGPIFAETPSAAATSSEPALECKADGLHDE